MVQGKPLHHISKRKRVHQKLEPYPHPDPKKRFIDKAIYVAALVGPLFTLPQIYNIWIQHNASGVSVITWMTFTITSFFWFYYGYVHNEKPIIFSSILWIIMQSLVWVGTLVYA